MTDREPDFTGWATKNDELCTDGRTIRSGAFKHMDGKTVPLVWMHQHSDNENVLGHVRLTDRAFGTFCEGFFNQTPKAKNAKLQLENGDYKSLSIYANRLAEKALSHGTKEVIRGNIVEVSLVLNGANPGALIENISIAHADNTFDVLAEEAIIHSGLEISLSHSDATSGGDDVADDHLEHADEESIQAVIDTMTEKQKAALAYVVNEAAGFDPSEDDELAHGDDDDDSEDDSEEEDSDETDETDEDSKEKKAKKDDSEDDEDDSTDNEDEPVLEHNDKGSGSHMSTRNVFDTDADNSVKRGGILSHADQTRILEGARNKKGKLSEYMLADEKTSEVLAHADREAGVDYGITDLDILFPEHRNINGAPIFIKRRTEWVDVVLKGVSKQPFAKIKTTLADITAEEARARGYVKGTEKKDEVIKLLKRTTAPTTVYKKQRLDRDDILDITDFDVVAWLKAEIRLMLDEEIARAILVGDGRSSSNPDKIKDPEGAIDGTGIRSIANDHEMYAHQIVLDANISPEDRIDAITRARSFYRGSGGPTMFTTDNELTDLLLEKDKMGRRLYPTEQELAAVLRVKDLVSVEVLEEHSDILAIIVNLVDYTVGANKGGEVSFFDDFDIDFNQEKYLMETRISGALNRPKSAIVIRRDAGEAVNTVGPSFANNEITIPNVEGLVYSIDGEPVDAGDYEITEDAEVTVKAEPGYYIPAGQARRWNFTYTP